MTFYILLFIFLLLVSFVGAGKRVIVLSLLIMAFFLGFRGDEVGTDTPIYIAYYNMIWLQADEGYMELGWNTLIILCKKINLSAQGFHFFIALLTLIPFYFVITDLKDRKQQGIALFLVYALGFYLYMFNGMRQFLAISIVFWGYSWIVKGRTKLFFLSILLASTIHQSALVALSVIILRKIKLSSNRILFVLFMTYMVGLILEPDTLSNIAGAYSHYIIKSNFREGYIYSLTVVLLTNILFIWLYFLLPSCRENIWVNINLLSIVFMNLLSSLILGPRIVYFFSISQIMAIPVFMSCKEHKLVRPILYLYSIITLGRFLLPEMLGAEGDFIPYDMNIRLFE